MHEYASLFFALNDVRTRVSGPRRFGSMLFLRFELLDERSEMRGNGIGESVVLILKALPNCGQPNASVASRTQFASREMGLVTGLNDTTTNPIIDPVGCLSRGGDSRHEGASLSRAAHTSRYRLTLELN